MHVHSHTVCSGSWAVTVELSACDRGVTTHEVHTLATWCPPGPTAPPQPHHSEVSPGVKPSGSEPWDSACFLAPGAGLGMLCLPPLDCRKRTAWWRPTESFLMERSLIRKGRPLETNPMNEARTLLPGKSHGWRSLVGCGPWGC